MAWSRRRIEKYIAKLLKPLHDRLTPLESPPWSGRGALALLTSCGIVHCGDRPFETTSIVGDPTLRRLEIDRIGNGYEIHHGHYEESAIDADLEVCLPIAMLNAWIEAANNDNARIESLHRYAYSFLGYSQDVVAFCDEHMAAVADELKRAEVSAALLTAC